MMDETSEGAVVSARTTPAARRTARRTPPTITDKPDI